MWCRVSGITTLKRDQIVVATGVLVGTPVDVEALGPTHASHGLGPMHAVAARGDEIVVRSLFLLNVAQTTRWYQAHSQHVVCAVTGYRIVIVIEYLIDFFVISICDSSGTCTWVDSSTRLTTQLYTYDLSSAHRTR